MTVIANTRIRENSDFRSQWPTYTDMIRLIFSLIILVFFLALSIKTFDSPWLDALEQKVYDIRLNWSLPNTQDSRIVILDIDERSLKKIGRWPWNRQLMANLLDTLFDHYYIQTLGFDILFAEPDTSSGLQILEKMANGPLSQNQAYLQTFNQIRLDLDYDQQFVDALKDRDIVLGYFFRNQANKDAASLNTGLLPPPLELIENFKDPENALINPSGYGANLEIFQSVAIDGGFIDVPTIDDDGIARTIPLIQHYNGQTYQSFALGMARAILGFPPLKPIYMDLESSGGFDVLEALQIEDINIPVSEIGVANIPYRGKHPSYTYVSVIDVLEQKVDMEILDGAIVLMGTTATGLLDMRATPVQNVYPGVEIHANIISGILDDTIKLKPFDVRGVATATHLIVGILAIILFSRVKMIYGVFIFSALIAALISSNFYVWNEQNLIFPIVSPVAMVVALFVWHIAYGYFIEDYKKRKLNNLFGQYVPPELVEEMNNNKETISTATETRELTVLFSDVRGFTSISESLDPTDLTNLMNQYLTEMTSIIHRNKGTIDKYIGDAIMAFWGAPLHNPDHAKLAMQAAMEMQEAIPRINEKFEKQGFPKISIGVGLNTGKMNVGNMGSEFRMAYTVLGDAVNLAARLESITKQYGVSLIVSENTKNKAEDWIYQEIDLVKVVGKNIPISIYKPVSRVSEINPIQQKEMYLFKLAVRLYRERNWADAKKIVLELIELTSGPLLYQLYLGRIIAFQKEAPPSEWDGTFEAKSK